MYKMSPGERRNIAEGRKCNRNRESGIASEKNELDGARSREKAELSRMGLSNVGELNRCGRSFSFLRTTM